MLRCTARRSVPSVTGSRVLTVGSESCQPLLWPDPTPPAMPGDDTPETMSLAPSSPARAWDERWLRGRAWAAAHADDTPAPAQCPARGSRGRASDDLDGGPRTRQGEAVASSGSRDDHPYAAGAAVAQALADHSIRAGQQAHDGLALVAKRAGASAHATAQKARGTASNVASDPARTHRGVQLRFKWESSLSGNTPCRRSAKLCM